MVASSSSWRAVLILGVGAVLMACPPREPNDQGGLSDAGMAADASQTADGGGEDASQAADAGGEPDASQSMDAGAGADASSGSDAGEQSDAGVMTDGGTTTTTTDAGEGSDAGTSTGDGGLASYLENCNSLFAARILEKQVELDGTFPSDCTVALRNDIGMLRQGGAPMCTAGETPNACRDRVYDTPPSLDGDLPAGCWTGTGPTGCLRGTYLPKCADGTDTNCTEPEAVCQDGTRPLVYAEAATTGPSNIWLIAMGGEGGPCTGPTCWFNYRYAHLVGDTPFSRAMSTLHPDYATQSSENGGGVTAGTGGQGNPFAGYNRVRFNRCSDSASNAIETVPLGDGVPPEAAAMYPGVPVQTRTSSAPVWHRGFSVWKALFHKLAAGSGVDLDGDGQPDLPSLASATTIVLAGSSDASMWLTYAGDRLAEELRAIAGPNVVVRILIDGNFPPALDNEGRYHANAPANFNVFANPYGSTGLCELPDNGDGIANEACSSMNYEPGGMFRGALEARGVMKDVSCEAYHGVDAPECFDRMHTLLQHVETPVLVLSDQEDVTVSGSGAIYADDRSYSWDVPATYRLRVLDQAKDVVAHWATAAREDGAGTPGNFALILPKARRNNEGWGQATHVRFGDNMRMAAGMTRCTANGAPINTVAFGTMIGTWIANMAPGSYVAEDASAWDGASDYWVTGNTCRAPE